MFREAAGEPTPTNGGEGGGGDEPWEIWRQNILGKANSKCPRPLPESQCG